MFPVGAHVRKIIPGQSLTNRPITRSTSTLFMNMNSPYGFFRRAKQATLSNRFLPVTTRSFCTDDKRHGTGTTKLLSVSNPYQSWEDESLRKRIAENDLTAMKCVERSVVLKDGGTARISLLTPEDTKDVERLYERLSHRTMSIIKSSTCAYRNRGRDASNYQSYLFLSALADNVVLGIKATGKSGTEQLSAISFYLRPRDRKRDRLCMPYGTVVADEFQGKGMGVALKKAQIECAKLDGMVAMINSDMTQNTVKVWRKAAAELGLRFTETTTNSWCGPVRDYRIDFGESTIRH